MRKVLISLALASAVVAAPAIAQPGYGYQGGYQGGGYGYDQGHRGGQRGVHQQLQRDIDRLENRIDRSAQRGRISRREAISLRYEADSIRRDYYRFSRRGLNRGEARNLAIRVDRLQSRLRIERADYDGRGW